MWHDKNENFFTKVKTKSKAMSKHLLHLYTRLYIQHYSKSTTFKNNSKFISASMEKTKSIETNMENITKTKTSKVEKLQSKTSKIQNETENSDTTANKT